MSMTQLQTRVDDSYKEAIPARHTQPGLEAVYLQEPGYNYSHSTTHGLHVADPNHPHSRKAPPPPQKKKMLWYWVLLGGAVLVIVGLAAGLGVGLSGKNSDKKASPASSELDADLPNNATTTIYASNQNPESTPTTTLTTMTSTPDSSSSSSNSTSPSSPCPSANNTLITQTLGSKKYRIYCDSDFGGSGKKTLASVVLSSFEECVGLCNTMNWFQERSDVGATFNVAGTGSQTPGTCWCLGGTRVRSDNVGNDAAFPVDD